MVSWSTEAIGERERFSYWRDVVCQSLFNVSAEAPRGRFQVWWESPTGKVADLVVFVADDLRPTLG